jgi:hypothetical protein
MIPILAGSVSLTELMGGAEITANKARFFASPIPVTVHIVSVTVYSLLGALQFVPSLRRGRRSWHRGVGRSLVPAGGRGRLAGAELRLRENLAQAHSTQVLGEGGRTSMLPVYTFYASCLLKQS